MKTKIVVLSLFVIFFCPFLASSQSVLTLPEVYDNAQTLENDTITIIAYYTDTTSNILVHSYAAFLSDEVMPPHSMARIDGTKPPQAGWRGGLISVYGIVQFQLRHNPYHPEDGLMAVIQPLEIRVLLRGEDTPESPGFSSEGKSFSGDGCDPCKFAILISGGVIDDYNYPRYWKNLVELYEFKVEHEGYCPENILVHYYEGDRESWDIPSDNVLRADSASIADSFKEISRRIAECSRAGLKSTFQKMVYNHGMSNGYVNLLDRKYLKPSWLRDWQQMLIDSCCSTIYDEFLQCYAGIGVDQIAQLDDRNKTKIYINSAANRDVGMSKINDIHPYLKGKLDLLRSGMRYEDAVAAGKLAYDQHLRNLRSKHDDRVNELQRIIDSLNYLVEVLEGMQDQEIKEQAKYNNRICQSKNIIITPMKKYCEYHKYVLPPGGQLVLKFSGEKEQSGNVTVYRVNPNNNRLERVRVWNWNIPGSARYSEFNHIRVINGDPEIPKTYWVHNDNGEYTIKGEVYGSKLYPEHFSNRATCSGFSAGGSDGLADEFGEIRSESLRKDTIDGLNISLGDLPGYMGADFVPEFQFTFSINPEDTLWQNMELYFELVDVMSPGILQIEAEGAESGYHEIPVEEPGIYIAHLGDMREMGYDGTGQITFRTQDAQFGFDCWGLRISDNQGSSTGFITEDPSDRFRLAPNPFGPGTVIEYDVPQSGEVDLVIYDLSGRIITILKDSFHEKGTHRTYFDAHQIPNGMYLLRMSLNDKPIGTTKISKVEL